MITAGIDCGAKNTKTVILKDGEIVGKAKVLTGFDQNKAAEESLEKALTDAEFVKGDVQRICGTGSGKDSVTIADVKTDDIKAMSKGANFFFPNARTVVDVGAEEGRTAKIDENGNPIDFAINEKCAAGAGVFFRIVLRSGQRPRKRLPHALAGLDRFSQRRGRLRLWRPGPLAILRSHRS